jgi:hypothetical protein
VRFRVGDDIVQRIRASLLRRDHVGRHGVRGDVRPGEARITYYGRQGEMGHAEDRADDWPEADTRGERS